MIVQSDLKILRTRVGFTQAKVANLAQISERQFMRIENGEQEPKVSTAIRIAEALGIQSFDKFKDLFGAATPKEDRGNDTSKE